jgi:hypothetical protein
MPGSRRDIGAELLTDAAGMAPGNGDGGLSVQMFAELAARIGNIDAQITEQNNRAAALWKAVRPIPGIPVPQITSTTGTADYPELLSPRTGYWWFIIQAGALTFTAGSVSLYRQAVNDSQLVGAFPSAGYLTYSSIGLPIMWDQRLVFAANTVTGNVTPNLATVIEVADWAVPAYVM